LPPRADFFNRSRKIIGLAFDGSLVAARLSSTGRHPPFQKGGVKASTALHRPTSGRSRKEEVTLSCQKADHLKMMLIFAFADQFRECRNCIQNEISNEAPLNSGFDSKFAQCGHTVSQNVLIPPTDSNLAL
jgi:hypothetical protein